MMFNFWYNFTRLFYYPLFNWVLPLFNKKIKLRLDFESKNFNSEASISFKISNEKALYAFEVSSEGELEQVKPVLIEALNYGSKVELIYCSESVEKQCITLYEKYSTNLRILRLPILSFNPFSKFNPNNWLTASSFYLCRYDFFPELIHYGRKKDIEFYLLAGTLKNSEAKENNFILKWYTEYVYNSFSKILMATENDRDRAIRKYNISEDNIMSYDFRPMQIFNRSENFKVTLAGKSEAVSQYCKLIETGKKEDHFIFGSFWNDENILTSKIDILLKQGKHLAIAPHKLDAESIKEIKASIATISSQPVYELNDLLSKEDVKNCLASLKENPGVMILNFKGILCELYNHFGHAYIAGGYRLSVHSLLEPFIANCMVYCGPKVHRSTEYDLIRQQNPDHIQIIENEKLVIDSILKVELSQLSNIDNFRTKFKENYFPILDWLGIKTIKDKDA